MRYREDYTERVLFWMEYKCPTCIRTFVLGVEEGKYAPRRPRCPRCGNYSGKFLCEC